MSYHKPRTDELKAIFAKHTMYIPEMTEVRATYIVAMHVDSFSPSLYKALVEADFHVAVFDVEGGKLAVISEYELKLLSGTGFEMLGTRTGEHALDGSATIFFPTRDNRYKPRFRRQV